MEILYSARSTSEYIALETELDALRILRNDRAVADAAMSALSELAEQGSMWDWTGGTLALRPRVGSGRLAI
jgi:hypothetical protein